MFLWSMLQEYVISASESDSKQHICASMLCYKSQGLRHKMPMSSMFLYNYVDEALHGMLISFSALKNI